MTTPPTRKSINRSPFRLGFILITLALASFAASPGVQAISPTPDGCYPNFTTAEGCNALNALSTGAGNTGVGWSSLFSNTTGNFNTGIGTGALVTNNGDSNTATGTAALLLNTAGVENTAVGTASMVNNDAGNTNTAVGAFALTNNISGSNNTAVGDLALQNSTGDFNTALGANAGTDPGIVSNNIYVGDPGFAGDENVISIGGIAASERRTHSRLSEAFTGRRLVLAPPSPCTLIPMATWARLLSMAVR